MIKLIASDMDGTLLDGNGNVPKDFFRLFKHLKEKGIVFAAASGRQYYTLLNNLNPIQEDIIFIAENGTFVLQQDQELYSCFLSPEIVNELICLSRKIEGAEIVVCGKKSAYIESDNTFVEKEVEKYYTRYQKVKDLTQIQDDVLKFTLCDLKGSSTNSYPILYELYKDKLQVMVSGEIWLDIINPVASKGSAIQNIQKKLNIQPEETMVFGDYFNDVEMLQSAYHSYAMENAPEGVKKYARFIARSNEDAGVLRVIEEMLLKDA